MGPILARAPAEAALVHAVLQRQDVPAAARLDRLGAVGAASAPLFAALAVVAASLGRAPGPHLLLCSTGPGALAGAALLEAPVEPQER